MANTRKELAEKKAQAYRLFMAGTSQKDIAAQTGITEKTVSVWVNTEGWNDRLLEEKTSSVELANSMMLAAKKMTEIIIAEINKEDYNIDAITKCSDNVVKIMASAERIANTINKATVIDVLTSLDRWLLERSKTDRNLTPELLAIINRYHQEYIVHIAHNGRNRLLVAVGHRVERNQRRRVPATAPNNMDVFAMMGKVLIFII